MVGLIADIGATNARFALADEKGFSNEHVLPCADYPGILEAIQEYLKTIGPSFKPVTASVAIAGPVVGDRFEMMNHNWSFSVEETRQALGLKKFHLLNDFEALALAVPHLKGDEIQRVYGGDPVPRAPIGIVGPGTGLGVASMIWDGRGAYRPVPGEGGHVTMAAKTQREFDVFQYLLKHKYHHISAERVCSGKGLVNIYNGLRGVEGYEDDPEITAEEISRRALAGSCPLSKEALDMMLSFLGRMAGNLAVTLWAQGGIYIAGGIVNKLGDYFGRSNFHSEFVDKGRCKTHLEKMPIYIIKHKFPAFVGLRADMLAAE